MTLGVLIISFVFLTGCNNNILNKTKNIRTYYFFDQNSIEQKLNHWVNLIKNAACKYKVDEILIKAIIYAESAGNPYAKSKSNAIGLMQIKPSAAGLEVYRLYGKKGQPSIEELYNPKKNINIGTAYINFLQKKLSGIKNKNIMRYATIVAYSNGINTLLKTFSKNHQKAITIINNMTKKNFFLYIKKNIQKCKHQNI
ncbi:transglycosylase SLT domain-containing protein [Buchnera aphidicola]|uniref:peptidoglycan lytic exotransglycosylase n=1 Tax=Buchnera aphidicola str. Ua (Uroleucon ambrosiae) TaxID=1005057 RepID=G2LPC6_BUCUM|nr:transglycosylase SLT domain-containing protein [Buchnera aphidicola]AEO08063.1 membrane-bound lytic murein transglycosylase E [Buchnera aphidicola str. Ua (Uroleucon ambrosiae)]